MRSIKSNRASNTVYRAVLPAVIMHVHVRSSVKVGVTQAPETETEREGSLLLAGECPWPSAEPRRPAAEAHQAKGGLLSRCCL